MSLHERTGPPPGTCAASAARANNSKSRLDPVPLGVVMVRRLSLLLVEGVALLLAGCAQGPAKQIGTYVMDRSNDFADCFKLYGGAGGGVDVQFRATDWLVSGAGFVMENQQYGWEGRKYAEASEHHVGFPVLPFLTWYLDWPFAGSNDQSINPADRIFGPYVTDYSQRLLYFDEPRPSPARSSNRSILIFNLLALPGVRRMARLPYEPWEPLKAFDVEIGATVILSGRVGFSIGQFVDFVLGWTTLDIANDDRSLARSRP